MRAADLLGLVLFGVIAFPFVYFFVAIVQITVRGSGDARSRVAWTLAITALLLVAGYAGMGDPYLH